jgi:hypothetical protein
MVWMWASTVFALRKSDSEMAWLVRPSATRARTCCSRSVSRSSGLWVRRRWQDLGHHLWVDHGPPAGDPVERVDEFVDVGDPVLEQVADSSGSVAEKFHGVVGLDVLRQHQDTHVCVLGADLRAAWRPSCVWVGGIRMSTITASVGRCVRARVGPRHRRPAR